MNQKKKKNLRHTKRSAVHAKIGLPPGSLVHTGTRKMEDIRVVLRSYDPQQLVTNLIHTTDELQQVKQPPKPVWIQINGLHDTQLIGDIGRLFNVHPLILEDILNTNQRPKIELMDDQLFLIIRTMDVLPDKGLVTDQIGFILKDKLLISFHESELDIFAPLYKRLESDNSYIRAQSTDYLLYAMIDIVVDNYFNALDHCANQLDYIENLVFEEPTEALLAGIQEVRKDLLLLKKTIYPLRDLLQTLSKTDVPVISFSQHRYLRDVYDHVLFITETIETYRELNTGLREAYLSAISNNMNQVMKTLTIIATIFIPLTFIAGVYGMNFRFMPELNWKYGYILIWGIMLAIAAWMVYRFKKLKWF